MTSPIFSTPCTPCPVASPHPNKESLFLLNHTTFAKLPLLKKLIEIGLIDTSYVLRYSPTIPIPLLGALGKERWKKLMDSFIEMAPETKIGQYQYVTGFATYLSERRIAVNSYLRGGYAAYILCPAEYLECLIHDYIKNIGIPASLFAEDLAALKNLEQSSPPPNDIDWLDITPTQPAIIKRFLENFLKEEIGNHSSLTCLIPTPSPLFPTPQNYLITYIEHLKDNSPCKTDRIIGRLSSPYMFMRDNLMLELQTYDFPRPLCLGNFWQMILDRSLNISRLEERHVHDFRTGLAGLQHLSQGHLVLEDKCRLQDIFDAAYATDPSGLCYFALERCNHLKNPLGYLISCYIQIIYTAKIACQPIPSKSLEKIYVKIKESLQTSGLPFRTIFGLTKCFEISEFPMSSFLRAALLLIFYSDSTKVASIEWDSSEKKHLIFHLQEASIGIPRAILHEKVSDSIPIISELIDPSALQKKTPSPAVSREILLFLEKSNDDPSYDNLLFLLALQSECMPLSHGFLSSLCCYLANSPAPEELESLSVLLLPWLHVASPNRWLMSLLNYSYKHGMQFWNLHKNTLMEDIRLDTLEKLYTASISMRPNSSLVHLEAEIIPKEMRERLYEKILNHPQVNPHVIQKLLMELPWNESTLQKAWACLTPEAIYDRWRTSPPFLLSKEAELLMYEMLQLILSVDELTISPNHAMNLFETLAVFYHAAPLRVAEITKKLIVRHCQLLPSFGTLALQEKFFSILNLYKIPLDKEIPQARLSLIEACLAGGSLEAMILFQNYEQQISVLPAYFDCLIRLYFFSSKLQPQFQEGLLEKIARYISSQPLQQRQSKVFHIFSSFPSATDADLTKAALKFVRINGIDEKKTIEYLFNKKKLALGTLEKKCLFDWLTFNFTLPLQEELYFTLFTMAQTFQAADLDHMKSVMKKNSAFALKIISSNSSLLDSPSSNFLKIAGTLCLHMQLNDHPEADSPIFIKTWKNIFRASLKTQTSIKEFIPFFANFPRLRKTVGELEIETVMTEWIEKLEHESLSNQEQKELKCILLQRSKVFSLSPRILYALNKLAKAPFLITTPENELPGTLLIGRIEDLLAYLHLKPTDSLIYFRALMALLKIGVESAIMTYEKHAEYVEKVFDLALEYPFDKLSASTFDPIFTYLNSLGWKHLTLSSEDTAANQLDHWNLCRSELLKKWILRLEASDRKKQLLWIKNQLPFQTPSIEHIQLIYDISTKFKTLTVRYFSKTIPLNQFKNGVHEICSKAIKSLSIGELGSCELDPCILCIEHMEPHLTCMDIDDRKNLALELLFDKWISQFKKPPEHLIHYRTFLTIKKEVTADITKKFEGIGKGTSFYFDMLCSQAEIMKRAIQSYPNHPFFLHDPFLEFYGHSTFNAVDRRELLALWHDNLRHASGSNNQAHFRMIRHLTQLTSDKVHPAIAFTTLTTRISLLRCCIRTPLNSEAWLQELAHIVNVANTLPKPLIERIQEILESTFDATPIAIPFPKNTF